MQGNGGGGRPGFRHGPPAVHPASIERARLQQRLTRRFQATVTVMAAPAGYGKTSALARALVANEADPAGTDLWLQCGPHDSDAAVLAGAIARSIGLAPPAGEWTGDGAALADGLLRFSPNQVCLVLDDVHLIPDGSTSLDLLQDLVDALPRHAHLLLAGRRALPLRLARLRVEGRCEDLGLADLEFDSEEADRASGGSTGSDLARWPAMSSLVRADRPEASADYLLEEVAGALGSRVRHALTALSHLREVDDDLASAACDEPTRVADLLADLPLVLRSADGRFQMHDLWHTALVGDSEPHADAVAALVRVAQREDERGQHLAAAEHFAAAGDGDGLARAALAIIHRPMILASASELRTLATLIDPTRNRPLSLLVGASLPMTRDELASANAFEAAAAEARACGEREVEVAALQNELNLRSTLDPGAMPDRLVQRIDELATETPSHAEIRPLHAVSRMLTSKGSGDPEDAVRHLVGLNPMASPFERIILAFALADLGRPEEVTAPDPSEGTPEEVARLGGQYLGQAMWLRGDAAPELAFGVAMAMSEATAAAGAMVHVRISTSSVLTLVALAAGDVSAARRGANEALGLVSRTSVDSIRTFASLADAATVLFEQGEEAAAVRVATTLKALPIGRWPSRPYLYSLPLVYLLDPPSRPALDGCRFGPALTAARDAGAALVSLRDRDDAGPAAALPWHRPSLLRVHVLAPHLVELAAAAASRGMVEAGRLVEEVPNGREHLLSVASTPARRGAVWAAERAAALPARPDHDLILDVLGPLRFQRGPTPVADAHWVRRDRVRQLLTVLVLHGRITRRKAASVLWPELDSDKAAANLRVTLSYLQKVLEPTRGTAELPWFLRTDRESISVHHEGLSVDAKRFDELCRSARTQDDAGRGTRAIAAYRRAAELYRGEYAAEWPDADWAQTERLRLHVVAVSAMTRLGELVLARGEPEEAGSWATKAIRTEPLDERAHRLFAQSLAAQGNQPGAARALDLLAGRLDAEGLTTDRETTRLLESYRANA